jgi:nicotinate dehydrogenase subunit A
MKQQINLTVDGNPVSMDVEPDTPLLYALRGEAGSINPKFGCGLAQCGACTVRVNGKTMRSCIIPVSAVADSDVITLGGLSNGENLHPLQRAFIEEQVPQCGYCLSGWMMTAAALLERNPDPTDADIRRALTGIKCRCGTHMAIIRAVKRAAGYGRA